MKKTLLLVITFLSITILSQAQPGTLLSAKKIGVDNSFQFFDTLSNHFTFGRSLCNIGDLDGDGVADIAVGVVDQNISSGVVYILFLNSNGGVKSYKRIAKNEGGLNTSSPNAFSEFGQSIANLGDLDGDGVVDIAVGNKGSGFGGEVYILFMNTNGTVKSHQRITSFAEFWTTRLAIYGKNDTWGTKQAKEWYRVRKAGALMVFNRDPFIEYTFKFHPSNEWLQGNDLLTKIVNNKKYFFEEKFLPWLKAKIHTDNPNITLK